MQEPLDIATKYYFWKPYAAYFHAFELKGYGDFVQFPENGLVLDLGCSDGTFGQILKELLEFKTPLIGVDCDENRVKKATRRTNVYSQVLQNDASSHLEFDDESFDAVFANQILHCIPPNPEKVIKEVSRILKKDGIFICTVVTDLVDSHFCVAEFLKKLGLNKFAGFYSQSMCSGIPGSEFVSKFSSDKWCKILEGGGLTVQNVVPFISQRVTYRWSLLTLPFWRVMGFLKILPLKGLHSLSSKIMKRLMVDSYNKLSNTVQSEPGDYILIICKKL